MIVMNGRNNRYPFTASQWQELEHQALIFKYMASGHPIPSDLLLPLRRNISLDSISPASLFPHQPNIGWGCFQMGFGRKMEDPEPGRCRRTDGKKWRCSKEAHPDSKYCERHMHRGKNRSRKPVETSLTTTSNSNNTTNTITSSNNSSSSNNNGSHQSSSYVSSLRPAQYQHQHHLSMGNSNVHQTFCPYPSSYSRQATGIGLSHQNPLSQLHLDSGSSTSADRDFRYFHGMREEVDQYSCFSEASREERDGSWRFTPLGMSSLGEPRQRSSQQQQDFYSYLSTTTDLSKERDGKEDKHEQQQHCFVLGADFKLQTPSKDQGSVEEESQKPLRRFFDEWPPKNKGSWIDLEEDKSNWTSSLSKTQLSISTPMAHHDHFAIANSHSRTGTGAGGVSNDQ